MDGKFGYFVRKPLHVWIRCTGRGFIKAKCEDGGVGKKKIRQLEKRLKCESLGAVPE